MPRPRFTLSTIIIGVLLGGVPMGAAGLIYNSWGLASLEHRFEKYVERFDALSSTERAEHDNGIVTDEKLEREIADLRRDVARIDGALPLKLPTINQLIDQGRHIDGQDVRMDGIERRIAAVCGQLAGISAASAKKAGC